MVGYDLVGGIPSGEKRMTTETGCVEVLYFIVGALGRGGGEVTLLRIFLRLSENALGQWTHLRDYLL